MSLNDFIARATSFFDKAEAAQGGNKEIETIKAKVAELEGQLAEGKKQIEAKAAELETAKADLKKAQEGATAKDGEITALKASLESEKKRVDETLATMGVDPSKIPAEKNGGKAEPGSKSKLAEYNAIADPAEKTLFYRKHKAEINSAFNQ